MTNFQGSSSRGVTREQVLLWAPVLLGGVLAVAAGALLLVPSLQQLQRDQVELLDLKQQEARMPVLRLQLSKQLENLQEVQMKGNQILQLIAGSGDISTFMAQLSQEARRSGVQLDSYEPVTTLAASTTTNDAPAAASQQKAAKPPEGTDSKQPPPPPVDPLLAPGLQKTSLLITARGQGPQLNQFLRRLESLSLLVVQSDLAVKYEPGPASANGKPPAAGVTTLKLNLALYSKAAVGSTPEPPPSSAPAKS